MKKEIEFETPIVVEVINVIHVEAKRGKGTDANPIRIINQYWDFSGHLLSEYDPLKDS